MTGRDRLDLNEPQDERQLILGCLHGERGAWEAFVRRYTKLVYYFIKKIEGSRSALLTEDEIADLHNDIFLSLLEKKLAQFEGRSGCSLTSWIKIVTASTTLNFLRSRKTRTKNLESMTQTTDEAEMGDRIIRDNSPSPDEYVQVRQTISHLENIIDKLPPREKLFVLLYYERQLPTEEVARVLQTSSNALYVLKNRVRKKLKDALNNRQVDKADGY